MQVMKAVHILMNLAILTSHLLVEALLPLLAMNIKRMQS
jgi:hypothetical protein